MPNSSGNAAPEDSASADESATTEATPPRRGPGVVVTLLLIPLIVAVGGLALWVVFNTEPKAERGGATRETRMLVDVTTVSRGTHRPTIAATGTVEPARDIVLRPRVGGQVIAHAEGLEPGGIVDADVELIRLDPADYRHTLRQRRADLQQAEAELRRERGRQRAAKREYELSGRQLDGASEALALRQPQLASAQAAVESAQAGVERAQLDLDRTRIEAPFRAQVIEREVDVGSQVNVGDPLARLVGVATYWVEVTVPVAKLRWLEFAAGKEAGGAPVQIHNPGAWPDGVAREGRLFRLLGNLDDSTRMARVLVAVDDPLALDAPSKPRLLLGTFVEARMQGEAVADVVRLDRDYLRSNDTVWVMDEQDQLAIRDVAIAVRDSEYAYIREGLRDGERVVTSSLATVQDGAPLRLDGEARDDSSGDPVNGS